jgi:hypothetical protein
MNYDSLDVQESLITILSVFPTFITYEFEVNFGKQSTKQKKSKKITLTNVNFQLHLVARCTIHVYLVL